MSGVRGFFISLEGIDRSGKSTQARMLSEALGGDTLLVREPGGTPAGERIRGVLLDRAVELAPEAEAALYAAARAQLVERVVRPALEEGRTVVCDRYIDSSLAYQGGARGLGIDRVLKLNEVVTGGLWPELTLLIEVEAEDARRRDGESDRLEGEGTDFQHEVARAYTELANSYLERIVRIDGARPVEDVHSAIMEVVRERLPGTGR